MTICVLIQNSALCLETTQAVSHVHADQRALLLDDALLPQGEYATDGGPKSSPLREVRAA